MSKLKRKGDWAQTYTGKKFWPLDPRPEDVDIEDIAHSLALSCRFNGHCDQFYSIAQHSVFVSNLVSPSETLTALLHDGTEAYLGDIIRPLKMFLPNLKRIEKTLEEAIFQHFGIQKPNHEEIKRADNIALYTEMRDLMGKPPETWKEAEYYFPFLPKKRIIPLNPTESERLFLNQYGDLISTQASKSI